MASSALAHVLKSAARLQEVVPEAGLRQLRRTRPLETCYVDVGDGQSLAVPTIDEILHVKAYLVVQRNVVRDFLDVAALSQHVGLHEASRVLSRIDEYYADRSRVEGSMLTSLVVALADPMPHDVDVTEELPRYKAVAPRWRHWSDVVSACQELALDLGGAR